MTDKDRIDFLESNTAPNPQIWYEEPRDGEPIWTCDGGKTKANNLRDAIDKATNDPRFQKQHVINWNFIPVFLVGLVLFVGGLWIMGWATSGGINLLGDWGLPVFGLALLFGSVGGLALMVFGGLNTIAGFIDE